jgi:type I restriction enzyme S subunit
MGEVIKYNAVLPSGWTLINFSESCDKISLNGIKIKQKQYLPNGKYPVVDQGQELIGGYFDDEKVIAPNKPPYIIFGDHTKVKKYINFKFIAGADGVKVFKPFAFLNEKLFFYFLHCIKLPDKGYARHSQFLEKADIPLPPLPEQQRIVAKIEELFSSLDNGIESLKTAQQQLKVYRQAVLKWAFEKLKSEKEVEEITYEHSIGLVRSNNQQNEKGIGLPYIKMNNVDLNGNVDFTKVVFVKVNDEEAEKYALKKGDILINTRNSVELVGKTGIVREEKPNCVFNNNLLRIRTKSEYNPLFIGYQLISPWLRKQMLKEKKATTNVCALYQRDIFPLKVKVTDTINQNAIVAGIESRLSVCDKIEESIEHSLKQSEALRQSILKKAFEGKLVPQDPSDEPASKLLERIKPEKEKTASKKRSPK